MDFKHSWSCTSWVSPAGAAEDTLMVLSPWQQASHMIGRSFEGRSLGYRWGRPETSRLHGDVWRRWCHPLRWTGHLVSWLRRNRVPPLDTQRTKVREYMYKETAVLTNSHGGTSSHKQKRSTCSITICSTFLQVLCRTETNTHSSQTLWQQLHRGTNSTYAVHAVRTVYKYIQNMYCVFF